MFLRILFIFIFRGRGREEESEGEKHRCEKETMIGCLSHVAQPGIEATTQARALTRNRTSNLSLHSTSPKQLSHTGQGYVSFSCVTILFSLKVIIIFYLCSFLCSYHWCVPKLFNSSVSAPPNIHTCPHSQPPRSPVTTCSRLGCLLSRPDVQPSTWGFLPHYHGNPFVCSEMVPVSWIPCLHFPRFIPSSM